VVLFSMKGGKLTASRAPGFPRRGSQGSHLVATLATEEHQAILSAGVAGVALLLDVLRIENKGLAAHTELVLLWARHITRKNKIKKKKKKTKRETKFNKK